jgi:integrase
MDMVGKSLTMATRWEIMVARPAMPTLKVENKRERVMTDDEEAAIFQACAKRAEAEPARPWVRFGHLVRFLLDVGCRLGEALNVKLGDVEEIDGQWVVHFRRYETKNGKPRSIPLTDAVVASLPYLRMTAARGMLFPITAGTAWYMWDNLRDDVGDMEDVVLHTLRHTCITRLAARLPIQIVSLWAGHSDIKVTAGYTHLNTSNLVQAMQVLNTGR